MKRNESAAYVALVCAVCRTRMHAPIEDVGQKITCPDCGTQATIPRPAPAVPKPKRPDAGAYRLGPDYSGEQTGPASHPRPAVILVVCRLCGTRMHPRAEYAGRKVACPDCKTVNLIPDYQSPAKSQAAPDRVQGEYSVDAEAPIQRRAPAAPPPPRAIEDREPVPEPPRWVFFSGIYSFPWQSGVALRWVYLTIGLSIVAACSWMAYGGLASGIDVRGGVTGAGALSVPVFFFSFWTLSFAAACVLVIVQETAEGAVVVHEWPESDWRDWVSKFLFVLQMVFLALVSGWGVSRTLALAGVEPAWQWAGLGITAFVSLPFFLLSALETGSAFMPLSMPILASVFRLWWGWVVFYLETGLLLVALVASTLFGARLSLGMNLVMAPLFAAFILIYARLLGRLGWLIVDRLGTAELADDDED